jgi:hypothetical protein
MKITKLRTSKGFGKFVETLTFDQIKEVEFDNKKAIPIISNLEYKGIKYKLRTKYDSITDKEINIVMFLNSLRKPKEQKESSPYYNRYIEDLTAWKNREKQLLFIPEKMEHSNVLGDHVIDFYFENYKVRFWDDDSAQVVTTLPNNVEISISVVTLEHLAIYTNEELWTINLNV